MNNPTSTPNKIWKMSLGNVEIPDEDIVFKHCIEYNEIRLGHGHQGDYSECTSKDEVSAKAGQIGITLRERGPKLIIQFVKDMEIGDLVVVSHGINEFKALGIVTSDYLVKSFPPRNNDFMQVRNVYWLWSSVNQDPLPVSLIYENEFTPLTLYSLDHSMIIQSGLFQVLFRRWIPFN